MLSVVSIHISKYNIFHRSDEAMLLIIVKAGQHFIIILLFTLSKY